jgi:hypothetical protein
MEHLSCALRESLAAALAQEPAQLPGALVNELSDILRCLKVTLAECLAAVSILEAAVASENSISLTESCEWLASLRDLPHLLVPPDACADARLPETNMLAVRGHLSAAAAHDGQSAGLAEALACTLLPQWVGALPAGPHLSLQMRSVCQSLSTVVYESGSPLCRLAALNSLVAIVLLWERACGAQVDADASPPEFISGAIQILVSLVEQQASECRGALLDRGRVQQTTRPVAISPEPMFQNGGEVASMLSVAAGRARLPPLHAVRNRLSRPTRGFPSPRHAPRALSRPLSPPPPSQAWASALCFLAACSHTLQKHSCSRLSPHVLRPAPTQPGGALTRGLRTQMTAAVRSASERMHARAHATRMRALHLRCGWRRWTVPRPRQSAASTASPVMYGTICFVTRLQRVPTYWTRSAVAPWPRWVSRRSSVLRQRLCSRSSIRPPWVRHHRLCGMTS